MSRPRKPFGNKHPGRLPSTMMKVLAAEMSDPGRLRRGKQYAKDGSVLDIVIEPGVVTAEVQGSRPTPYVASIYVRAGDGMPLRRDLDIECSCPDDDNWDDHACKHALAAMLVLADEFLLEPDLLDHWRGRQPVPSAGAPDPHDPVEVGDVHEPDPAGDDRLAEVVPIRPSLRRRDGERRLPDRRRPEVPAPVDPLAALTAVPAGGVLPEIPTLDAPGEPPLPVRPDLARVLRDALRHATAGWD
jgi:hypothetical protein